ncbi:extracellular solute-binding protein [Eubacteriales bacterium OttesenSCG-928-A19]|nr:extracellular solute-binding protein [Eubacteriales bacterium OttesenSCG-928-A19]
MKKLVSFVLSLLMLMSAGLVFAETDFNETGLPIVNEPITFRIMAPKSAGNAEFDEMPMIQEQAARTGINIEWITVPNEMWRERMNLSLASGDLPDAYYKAGLTDTDVITYGEQGVLIDLKPLIDEYGENIQKVFDARPNYLAGITLPDGSIPALPYVEDIRDMTDCQQFFYINQVWLDKLGLDVPTTPDELFDVLMAFKTEDPNGNGKADEIPMSFMFDNRTNGLYYLFGAFGDVDNPLHLVLHDNKDYAFTANTDGYKEGAKFLNKLYSNGLLDPEGFTQDGAAYTAKARTEETVMGAAMTWRGDSFFGVDREPDYVLVEPLKGPEGHQNWGGFLGDSMIKNVFAITSACKEPEILFRWVDSLYEPDFAVRWNWGTAWEKNDEGIYVATTPPDGYSTEEWSQLTTIRGYVPTAILNEYYDTILIQMPSSAWRCETINEVYRKYMPEIIYSMDNSGQPYGLLPDEVLRLNELKYDITEYVKETLAKWIVEGGVDEDWDAYISQLERLNLDEMMSIYQTGYNRFRGWEPYPEN